MRKINLKVFVPILAGILVLVGLSGYLITRSNTNIDQDPGIEANASASQTSIPETDTASILAGKSTEDQLLYLIEEEKLAHDVYSAMYQKYGANVFGNILQSESTHQGRVLTLLQARSIADPRAPEVGVFKNQDLQNLYNQLIQLGSISATEAYKVGVMIEEKDIEDISTQLSTAKDDDVIAALESLRSGSENHLRAFNRQL